MPPVPVPVHESADAFVAEVGGTVCVSPVAHPSAGLAGPGRAAGAAAAPVLDAALPPVVREQAAADHERWRERNPDARP